MKIETERQASVTILTPAVRRLDASVAVAFKAAIAQEIGEDSTDLIVDFSKIDFIDSSGLGTLVSLMKMMNGKGEMTLCALNPGIRNMFTLTRMDRIFRICEDRQRVFRVEFIATEDRVTLRFIDAGEVFPAERLALARGDERFDVDPLAESGRGLRLILRAVDYFNVETRAGENVTTLIKALPDAVLRHSTDDRVR